MTEVSVYTHMWRINSSYPKKRASSCDRSRHSYGRTLATAFTFYKSNSREIFRNSKASEVTSAFGLEVTASSFAWTRTLLRCML